MIFPLYSTDIFLNGLILQVNHQHPLELWKSANPHEVAMAHVVSGSCHFSIWMITTRSFIFHLHPIHIPFIFRWICIPMICPWTPIKIPFKKRTNFSLPALGCSTLVSPGSPGQGNYSAANAALDGHARYWKQVLQAYSTVEWRSSCGFTQGRCPRKWGRYIHVAGWFENPKMTWMIGGSTRTPSLGNPRILPKYSS